MVQIELAQAATLGQVARHARQLIPAEVEAEQAGQAGQSGAGQGRQPVGNGHQVLQVGQVADCVRQVSDEVVADVQGTEGGEVANGGGQAAQLYTGIYQSQPLTKC